MEIRLQPLRVFVEVAKDQNISAAARRLGMSQPALSRQIKGFEDELGWELLDRGGKSVELTRAGMVVAQEGRRILRAVESGYERMRREIEGAEMRVGYAPSLAEGLIEKAMRCFVEEHPRVRVSWFDCSTEEMWRKLESGELDLILEVATDDPAIRWTTLRRKEFRLAVPKDHPLAKEWVVRPEDLDGERLLLLSRHEYPGYWEKVSDYFSEHGVNAKIAGEFDGINSLALGLEAGLGIALVAEGSNAGQGVQLMKLKPVPDPICVALGHSSKRRLEVWEEDFIEAMRSVG